MLSSSSEKQQSTSRPVPKWIEQGRAMEDRRRAAKEREEKRLKTIEERLGPGYLARMAFVAKQDYQRRQKIVVEDILSNDNYDEEEQRAYAEQILREWEIDTAADHRLALIDATSEMSSAEAAEYRRNADGEWLSGMTPEQVTHMGKVNADSAVATLVDKKNMERNKKSDTPGKPPAPPKKA